MSPKIRDEFSDLRVSRQRKWQLRKLREQLCVVCGKPAAPGVKGCCVEHGTKRREKQREKVGSKRRYYGCVSYKAEELASAKGESGKR